ncbi:hypothetical protein H6P81_003878 [Aristolochia fimbriata]|uniref:SWIM-type domain-containing protein n=1 Tax=Aristolochia fimbriata TaxID=158543 RepID=A0AAV7FGN8_ARIFI|nr:hypothetical protein H6P81_003878 [Aristolochia fimbriata]
MEIKASIIDLPVQDLSKEEFSSVDLKWTKYGTIKDRIDDVALIPYIRVDAFIIGECTNVEHPTRFHIEKGQKRAEGSLKEYKEDEYLEKRLYWCSFGPENYGEGGDILPSRRYRLNTRNRAARPQSMRGCTCHFIVKRLYARPSLALIIYNNRLHVNKSGFVCHGPLDRDAIGPGAKNIPYICNEVQQQTMSLIYLGKSEENVLQTHIEGVQRYCGSNAKVNSLATQYVKKLEMIIKHSTHELDLDDQASIRRWVEKYEKSVFFYQDSTETEPFILGIQTDWQLRQMARFGHHSIVAADSMFGVNKLKYPLYSLLVFDSRQRALPVAWIITRTSTKKDVSKWMKALVSRIRTVDSDWRISGFLIDDAAIEVNPIRDIFNCPVIFCPWRVRRKWLRNIIKRCTNVEVQREMFKNLGVITYSIFSGIDYADAIEQFIQDFVDQTSFMQYFRESWVPKIEMWFATMKSLPLASLEACGAIESYHMKLKQKIYDDVHLDELQRVDWLVNKLYTEIHSHYWLDRHADEYGSHEDVKEEYIWSSSWYRALQISDNSVTLDADNRLFAKVVSQKDNTQTHLVWNPGSEFSFCDCSWALQGNLCKHVIKVNMVCHSQNGYGPSMSYQSFQNILMNMWQQPEDDSLALDQSVAWINQMQEKLQRLVELNSSNDIGTVVNNLPLKWVCKKGRTFIGKPAEATLALPAGSKNSGKRRSRKRKRLGRLKNA